MRQGEIFWIHLPYSDLAREKHRPVLIVSNDNYNKQSEDVVACSVTSNLKERPYALYLDEKSFDEGSLPLKSKVRCDKIFSVEKTLFVKKMARLSQKTFRQVSEQITRLVSQEK